MCWCHFHRVVLTGTAGPVTPKPFCSICGKSSSSQPICHQASCIPHGPIVASGITSAAAARCHCCQRGLAVSSGACRAGLGLCEAAHSHFPAAITAEKYFLDGHSPQKQLCMSIASARHQTRRVLLLVLSVHLFCLFIKKQLQNLDGDNSNWL